MGTERKSLSSYSSLGCWETSSFLSHPEIFRFSVRFWETAKVDLFLFLFFLILFLASYYVLPTGFKGIGDWVRETNKKNNFKNNNKSISPLPPQRTEAGNLLALFFS